MQNCTQSEKLFNTPSFTPSTISHCHRIGGLYAAYLETSLYAAFIFLAICVPYSIMTACIPDNNTFVHCFICFERRLRFYHRRLRKAPVPRE